MSGFTALAYEVVWTRLFWLITSGLVYGFCLVLAFILAGIAVGSAAYGWLFKSSPRAVWHLVGLEFVIGAFLGSLPLWLPFFSRYFLVLFVTMLLTVFLSSCMFGMTFPAATRVCASSGQKRFFRFGGTYAVNVVGAALGSLAASFWFLPLIGTHATMLLLACLNVGCAVMLAFVGGRPSLSFVMALVGILTISPSILHANSLNLYRTIFSIRLEPRDKIVWFEEGVEASVAVTRSLTGRRLLWLNGQEQGGDIMVKLHRQLGHLGPLLHPSPRDALVIGMGSGVTAGTMAIYPVIRVHVVDLSRKVIAAAGRFRDVNYEILSNPRVTYQIRGGRSHLLLDRRRYDLIENDAADVPMLGTSDASLLSSREYFVQVRKALKPGGMVIHWLGVPGSLEHKLTLRTLASVFPYVTLWMEGNVAVGSSEPQPPLDRARIENFLKDPRLGPALLEAELGSTEAITRLHVKPVPFPLPDGLVITDDRPVNEFFLTFPLASRLKKFLSGISRTLGVIE